MCWQNVTSVTRVRATTAARAAVSPADSSSASAPRASTGTSASTALTHATATHATTEAPARSTKWEDSREYQLN